MITLYNKEALQINCLDERFYTLDGVTFYPSVTTVLEVYPKGYGFLQWLKDVGNNADEIVRRAGEQGSHVHDAIDQFLKGLPVYWVDKNEKPNYTLEEWQMILKFVEFWEKFQPKLIANEKKIVSEKLGIGGTIDLICEINGETWLIDYKTSNALYPSYELQLSAYAVMWNEENPNNRIDRHGLMWLKSQTRGEDKKGEKIQGKGWIVKEPERDYYDSYKIFNHCHAIWKEENPSYKPKNLVYPAMIKI